MVRPGLRGFQPKARRPYKCTVAINPGWSRLSAWLLVWHKPQAQLPLMRFA